MKRVFRVELNGEAEQIAGVTCDAIEDALADEKCPLLFQTITVTEVLPKVTGALQERDK